MVDDAQLKIRLPQEMKSFIEDIAKKNHRTINGEIVARLEESRKNSNYYYKITNYDGLGEPAMSLDMGSITIGLMQSKYHEIKLQRFHTEWCLSYYGLRAMINEELAQELIQLGCDVI